MCRRAAESTDPSIHPSIHPNPATRRPSTNTPTTSGRQSGGLGGEGRNAAHAGCDRQPRQDRGLPTPAARRQGPRPTHPNTTSYRGLPVLEHLEGRRERQLAPHLDRHGRGVQPPARSASSRQAEPVSPPPSTDRSIERKIDRQPLLRQRQSIVSVHRHALQRTQRTPWEPRRARPAGRRGGRPARCRRRPRRRGQWRARA